MLEKAISNANRILEKALDPKTKNVPEELFRKAEGILIYTVHKAGLGVTAKSGTGILLVKQHGGTWSNPAYFDLSEFGLGAAVGVEVKDVITFIMSPTLLKSLTRDKYGHITLGPDVDVTLGKFSATEAPQYDSSRDDKKVVSVAFSKGAFLGVSSNWGRMACPEFENHDFYGNKATPEDILTGIVDFPAKDTEIMQVYDKIGKLTAAH